MSLTIAGRLFTGPFDLETTVVRSNHQPAVFAIVAKRGEPWDPQFVLIGSGETGESGVVFSNHTSRAAWERTAGEHPPSVYLHTMPKISCSAEDRWALVAAMRKAYPNHNISIQEQGNARRGT